MTSMVSLLVARCSLHRHEHCNGSLSFLCAIHSPVHSLCYTLSVLSVLCSLRLHKWQTLSPLTHDFSLTLRTQLKLETLDDAVVLEDPKDDLLGEKHGCPVYCSPEILSSVTGRYSGRGADCWSLGVILYTMIVGRYPFHDANPTHLFGKICRGLFHIPPSISSLVRCIINSLLRKDPSERMTAQDLLACQLFSSKYMQTLERNNSSNSLHL